MSKRRRKSQPSRPAGRGRLRAKRKPQSPVSLSRKNETIQRARGNIGSLSRQDVFTLQRTIGNRATQQFLGTNTPLVPAIGVSGREKPQTLSFTDPPSAIQRVKGKERLLPAKKKKRLNLKEKLNLKKFVSKVSQQLKPLLSKFKRQKALEKERLIGGIESSSEFKFDEPEVEKEGGFESSGIAFGQPEEKKPEAKESLLKTPTKSDVEEPEEIKNQNEIMNNAEGVFGTDVFADPEQTMEPSQEKKPLVGKEGEKLSTIEKVKAVLDFKGEVKGVKENIEEIPKKLQEIKGNTPEVPKEATSALSKLLAPLTTFAQKAAPVISILKAVIALGKSIFSFASKTKTLIAFNSARKNANLDIDMSVKDIGHPLVYAVRKVFRGVVSRAVEVLSKLFDFIKSIVELIPQAKPWVELSALIKETGMSLITIGRSLKGAYKWLRGTKGVHRQLAAQSMLETLVQYGGDARLKLIKQIAGPSALSMGVAKLKNQLLTAVSQIKYVPRMVKTKLEGMAEEQGQTVKLYEIFKMFPEEIQTELQGNEKLKDVILNKLSEAMKSS